MFGALAPGASMISASLFVLVVAGLVLNANGAAAEWLPQQRTKFTNQCLNSCRNANPYAARFGLQNKCDAYCSCMLQEGQLRYPTPSDFDLIDRIAVENPKSEFLKRYLALPPMCWDRTQGR